MRCYLVRECSLHGEAAWQAGERASFVSTRPLRCPHLQSQKCLWQGQNRWQQLGSLLLLSSTFHLNEQATHWVWLQRDVTSILELKALGKYILVSIFRRIGDIFFHTQKCLPAPSLLMDTLLSREKLLLSSYPERECLKKPPWSITVILIQSTHGRDTFCGIQRKPRDTCCYH